MRTEYTLQPSTVADFTTVNALLTSENLPSVRIGELEDALTAMLDGQIVGFIATERYGNVVLLRSAVVDAAHRGHGLGSRLTEEILDLAKRRGVMRAFLLTTTADGYFTRFGFEAIDRADVPASIRSSAEFTSLCPESARAYSRAIGTAILGAAAADVRRLGFDPKTVVRESYARIATAPKREPSACCTPADISFADDYSELDGYEAEADLGLGCGIPTKAAALMPGDVVLDLGSGAGNDVFVAAREVGQTGRVIGLDFTPEMIDKARANARSIGASNVEFVLGDIEAMPLETESVDVILSNCVLNLVPDKRRAFDEMYRVLRPGGRFCVSDVVSRSQLPVHVLNDERSYAACVAGAIPQSDYLALLGEAGFADVNVYSAKTLPVSGVACRSPRNEGDTSVAEADVELLSITVRGTKSAA
jgi:arsenite methyltransferase